MKRKRPIKPGEKFNSAIHIERRKGERRKPGRTFTFEQNGQRVYHDRVWGETLLEKRSGKDRRKPNPK